jgi:hypothetical protein
VIQDDAELCGGFLPAVHAAIRARPEHLICLFVPTTLRRGAARLLAACAADQAFVNLDPTEWVPVVALSWPTSLIAPFLEWSRRKGLDDGSVRADDAIVGRFARENGQQVIATVPSLVEHPDDVDSILGLKTRVGRHAACFAGERASLIDWSR